MKYSVLSALIGATTAHADAPAYYNEPPFSVATHPAAAGLVQVESACAMYGVSGVTCGPSDEALFATGMNGDEDLGEDITMKGNKFHFVEKPAQLAQFATGMNGDEDLGEDITMKGNKFHFVEKPAQLAQFATGMNGDEDLGEDITMKGNKFHFNQNYVQFATGMNGDEDLGEDITMKGNKFHFVEKPEELVQFATGMNGDEDLGEDITMKGNKFHFVQNPLSAHALAQAEPKSTAVVYDTKGYPAPDKVDEHFDPKIAKAHTTFYNKK